MVADVVVLSLRLGHGGLIVVSVDNVDSVDVSSTDGALFELVVISDSLRSVPMVVVGHLGRIVVVWVVVVVVADVVGQIGLVEVVVIVVFVVVVVVVVVVFVVVVVVVVVLVASVLVSFVIEVEVVLTEVVLSELALSEVVNSSINVEVVICGTTVVTSLDKDGFCSSHSKEGQH